MSTHELSPDELTELLSGLTPEIPGYRVMRLIGRGLRPRGSERPVKLIDPVTAPVPQPRHLLPGLIGSVPMWTRVGQLVDAAYAAGEWLAVEGEPGAGKLALVRAVYQRRNPGGRLAVLEAGPDLAESAGREIADGTGALVVRHIDRLDNDAARAVRAVLGEAGGVWVAATIAQPRPEVRRLRQHD